MSHGATIQIFLPDGNPRSLKIAEITSRTLQAILIPRAKMHEAEARKELTQGGVYFLIGASDEDSKPSVYVGEAENTLSRLKQQNKEKDFWISAIAVVSKTQHLTKTHVKYLEWLSYDEAHLANRYKIVNATIPTKPYVSEPMEADLMDNFETTQLLVSTLGHPIFDKITQPLKKQLVFCSGKDASAEGEYTEDGLIVFAKSTCNKTEVTSAKAPGRNKRRELIEEGTLKLQDDVYVFTSDKVFSTPSSAATVVLGREANGWTEWKYKGGETLKDVHRQAQDTAEKDS